MARVGLITGSNLNNRSEYMNKAIEALQSRIGVLSDKSSIYVSPPWGYESTNEYYNQVLIFETNLAPDRVLEYCLRIEQLLGRERKEEGSYADRTIDIDMLFYDDLILNEKDLIVPHPRMHLRKFCLLPLFEVNPDWIHPVYKQDLIYLIDHCEDNSEISRLA